jgi:predicted nucleotide-binding protein (sugar kinase/HSP70/actin superfamily)
MTPHSNTRAPTNGQPQRRDERLRFSDLIGDGMPDGIMVGTYPGIGAMGSLVEGVAEFTNDPLVSPLPNSNETLNLGMQYCPEGACLPFKLIAGSIIQSMKRGANTVGMITERGPCRLGMYSLGLRILIKEMGLGSGWVDFDNTNIKHGYMHRFRDLYYRKFGKKISWVDMGYGFVMGMMRLSAIEALERERNRLLAREKRPGGIESAFLQGSERISSARYPWMVRRALTKAKTEMQKVPLDFDRPIVRVVIAGEVFCVVDPFSNGQVERRLAQLGAEPYRVLWQTDYLLHGLKMGRFGHLGGRPAAIRAARPYMAQDIGGDAAANVGHALMAHRRGDDGMIHIKPFACMMEFVTENILRRVSDDCNFPVLSLTLDDVNCSERVHVRIEAFVDNLFRRQIKRNTNNRQPGT